MTEQPYAGSQLTAEQQAYLRAMQAQQAVDSPTPAGEQAAVADQIAATERGPLLPAEKAIDDLMAQIKAQSDQIRAMQDALGGVQRQMEEAQAAQGGPMTVRYAQGAADKLEAMDAQWPPHDLADAREAAGQLVSAAKAAAKDGAVSRDHLHDAAAVIGRFARKLPHLDWSAILDDVELAVSEAIKIAA